MCLGIPGRIEEVRDANGVRMGTVSFGGIRKEVCLDCVPDATPGEYVVVHVGFAIARVEEDEARQVFERLARIGEGDGRDGPAAPDGASRAAPPSARGPVARGDG